MFFFFNIPHAITFYYNEQIFLDSLICSPTVEITSNNEFILQIDMKFAFKILSIVNLLYHKENCLVTSSHSLKQISCKIYIYKTKGLTHAKDPNAINWNKN